MALENARSKLCSRPVFESTALGDRSPESGSLSYRVRIQPPPFLQLEHVDASQAVWTLGDIAFSKYYSGHLFEQPFFGKTNIHYILVLKTYSRVR